MDGPTHHASVPWLAHDRRASGDLWITAFHPGGASRKWFQSYGPWRASYANIVGSRCDGQSMLRVFLTWGVRRSHNCKGNLLSVVARALIKWALKVWMARLAALTLWLMGLMRRLLQCCRVRYSLITWLSWLSISLSLILCPFDLSSSNCFL